MTGTEDINKATRARRWREKMTRSGYFFGALLLHLVLFLMVATLVIFQAPSPPPSAEFTAVRVAVPPPPPAQPPPSGSAAANPDLEPDPVTVPTVTPPSFITAFKSSFTVDSSKAIQESLAHQSLPKAQGAGLAKGAADVGSGTGKADFFGVQTGADAKRIAFLLDYSGSMSGKFRDVMEKQLTTALKKLSSDSQVIVICWAGPAWLFSETEPQIDQKWKKHSWFNFELLPGNTLDPPQWVNMDSDGIQKIEAGIKAQVSAPGGTDWRPAFRYVMKATPQPDVIFFLTDGQIPDTHRDYADSVIDTEMKKADRQPQINCLWIENTGCPSTPLEALAKKYNGEFRKVSAKQGAP